MPDKPALLEPSFVEAMAAIEDAADLSAEHQTSLGLLAAPDRQMAGPPG